ALASRTWSASRRSHTRCRPGARRWRERSFLLGGGLRPPSDGRRTPGACSSLPPPSAELRGQSPRSKSGEAQRIDVAGRAPALPAPSSSGGGLGGGRRRPLPRDVVWVRSDGEQVHLSSEGGCAALPIVGASGWRASNWLP